MRVLLSGSQLGSSEDQHLTGSDQQTERGRRVLPLYRNEAGIVDTGAGDVIWGVWAAEPQHHVCRFPLPASLDLLGLV